MRARRIVGALIFGLAAGCATAPATTTPTAVPTEDPMTQLRRDNAALRRRVQMLEDRMLYLEQRGDEPRSAANTGHRGGGSTVSGAHTLPDGRELPVVRLAPDAQSQAESRPARAPAQPAEPVSAYEPAAAYEPAPAPEASPQKYTLVGSSLVQHTRTHAPAGPDRPDRGKRGQAIISEYETAMAVYKSGQSERAEQAFDAFARQHPRHDYADNALYWKGEAAYDQNHFADALAAFTEVVERYGGGNKAPDALLKIGLCYRQLGDLPNARDVLSELIAAYPGERASDIARVKLAELES